MLCTGDAARERCADQEWNTSEPCRHDGASDQPCRDCQCLSTEARTISGLHGKDPNGVHWGLVIGTLTIGNSDDPPKDKSLGARLMQLICVNTAMAPYV